MAERLKQKAKLMYVALEKMRIRTGFTQREFKRYWALELAHNFSIDHFGTPVVNKTGEWFWIVDGQHRIAAYKLWLGDGEEWRGQKVECWVHHNLDEREEANLFDRLNTVKAVAAFDRFMVRLTAGREMETNITAIARLKKLKISRQKGEGAVACVGTLCRVYRRGPDCLPRGLEISYESFGDSGLESDIIDGLGWLISRFDGEIDDRRAIRAFGSARGGVNGLRSRAEKLRQTMGAPRGHCIAAAAVETYNRAKGGKKLQSWWKTVAADQESA